VLYHDQNFGRLYAGGKMFNINSGATPINCLSYYNGNWNSMGSGTPGINNSFFVNAITGNSNNSIIYFGGDFPNDSNGSTLNNIGYYDVGANTINSLQGITYGVTQVSSTPVADCKILSLTPWSANKSTYLSATLLSSTSCSLTLFL
jgi:hypothetical protein